MARISQIWAQSVTDFVAVQHSDFTPDAGGYAAAEAYLVANGGGVLYVGAGLESLAPVPPANVVVVRMRAGSAPGMEMWGNLILPAGFSIRATDSAGTRRTVLTPILDAINGDTLRIAYLNSLQGLLLTDQNGVEKARLKASRFSLGAGVDFAPNGLPGSTDQVLTSQGPGVPALFKTLAGLPGSTMYSNLQVNMWTSTVLILDATGYRYLSLGGGSDVSNYMYYTVPSSYTATTSWKVLWLATGDFGLTVDWRLSMYKVANAFDFSSAAYTDGATTSVAAPASNSILSVATIGTPALALSPGDIVMLRLSCLGAGDANNSSRKLIGAIHQYT